MDKATRNNQRSRLGYGSSYRKGNQSDFNDSTAIKTVLGGQVWMVKPDNPAHTAHPCVWMQTGAVKFKSCNNFFDCTTCKYDAAMNKKVSEGKQISWQDMMRTKPALERVCRHSLTQRIEKRACAYDYNCSDCDFDQFFEDVWTAKTANTSSYTEHVKGFDIPLDYHFHTGHTWARIENGGYIRIGLDDFALKLLGEADALDLPLMGKELDMGKVGWGFRRKDNLADILSPVGGIITEVNANVRETPQLANREPYGQGWLFLVRTPDVKKSIKALMSDNGSLTWMNAEVNRLEAMIEETAGPLAADGGVLQADIFGNLPQLGWKNLTRAFLKTG